MRLLDLYHRLPAPLRGAAAGLKGARLARRRYGPETEALVTAAFERERWDESNWRAWRQERLAAVLRAARHDVAGYQKLKGDGFSAFPVLDKETVRANPEDYVSRSLTRGRLDFEHTSGSTGTPLTIAIDRAATRAWYALHEARTRRWYGVSRGDRWAIFGGRPIVQPGASRPPYWVWNSPMQQLYLSSYHLSKATVADYLQALQRYRVRYLLGYPSAMDELAALALDAELEPPQLTVSIANAEPVYTHQRETIQRAFGSPVRETYGLAEMVVAASECEAGRLHLWPEVGQVEVLDDDDRPLPPGETGRLVCTGLLNAAMPLIRYDTGDRGRLAPTDERCECGRTLPLLDAVEGRKDDVVVLEDGRRIGRLDSLFKGDLPIRECQVVQTAPHRLVFRLVPSARFDDAAQEALLERSRSFLGSEIELAVERLERLERGPNGKLRGVVSEIDAKR